MLFYLKFKRELLRLFKPLLPAEFFTRQMRQATQQAAQWEARPTGRCQAQGLFIAPQFAPAPRPIDILIPVYNGYSYITPCLQSILQHTDLPFHIYLADDGSPDPQVATLLQAWKEKFPEKITLFINQQNKGFSKTANQLISASQNDFVLLNMDTEVPPAWASRLFYPIFTNDKVASCGPWTNSGSSQNFFFAHQETTLDVPLADMDKAVRDFSPDLPIYLPATAGFCMAVSRQALKQIGPLDEVYGRGYYEETDWCFRAAKAGFAHRLSANVFVYHKGKISFGQENYNQLMKQNRKIFLKRYPFGEKAIRTCRKNPLFQLISFVVLGRYLALKYPGFPKNVPNGPKARQEKDCYTLSLQAFSASVYQKQNPFPFFTNYKK